MNLLSRQWKRYAVQLASFGALVQLYAANAHAGRCLPKTLDSSAGMHPEAGPTAHMTRLERSAAILHLQRTASSRHRIGGTGDA